MSASHPRFVRREVRHLPPGDKTLAWYRRAVARMKARPHDNPTSWSYQAAIHGTFAARSRPLFNQCRHATWYFLPWHRMYLWYFERIVRAAVVAEGGPDDWALPYWNYGLGGRNATVPRAFRRAQTAAGHPNALHAPRGPGVNRGAALTPDVTSPTQALASRRFTGVAQFGGGITPPRNQTVGRTGQLEQTPHNDVHSHVGGLMGVVEQAAGDPLFWLHHANIDRLWAVWIGRGHVDPRDHRWTDQSFSFFDEHGHRVSKRCDEVLDTLADLHYTYHPAPHPVHPPHALAAAVDGDMSDTPEPEPQLVGATDAPLELTGAAGRVEVVIDDASRRQALAAAPEPRVILAVEDVEAEANPGTVYGVYVDLPDGAPAEVAALHRAGNLSFFGIERARAPRGDEAPHSFGTSYDITDLAAALEQQGLWDPARVEVSFLPLGLIPPEADDLDEDEEPPEAGGEEATAPEATVTVGRVSVYYE